MKQSELTLCASKADDLKRTIRDARGVVNSQQPAIVEQAIRQAEWIADRLRVQLPAAEQ